MVLVAIGVEEARASLSISSSPSYLRLLTPPIITHSNPQHQTPFHRDTGHDRRSLTALFSLGYSSFCLLSPSPSGHTHSLSVSQRNPQANKRKLSIASLLVPCIISLSVFPSAYLASVAVPCSPIKTSTAEAEAAAAVAHRGPPMHQIRVAHQQEHQTECPTLNS